MAVTNSSGAAGRSSRNRIGSNSWCAAELVVGDLGRPDGSRSWLSESPSRTRHGERQRDHFQVHGPRVARRDLVEALRRSVMTRVNTSSRPVELFGLALPRSVVGRSSRSRQRDEIRPVGLEHRALAAAGRARRRCSPSPCARRSRHPGGSCTASAACSPRGADRRWPAGCSPRGPRSRRRTDTPQRTRRPGAGSAALRCDRHQFVERALAGTAHHCIRRRARSCPTASCEPAGPRARGRDEHARDRQAVDHRRPRDQPSSRRPARRGPRGVGTAGAVDRRVSRPPPDCLRRTHEHDGVDRRVRAARDVRVPPLRLVEVRSEVVPVVHVHEAAAFRRRLVPCAAPARSRRGRRPRRRAADRSARRRATSSSRSGPQAVVRPNGRGVEVPTSEGLPAGGRAGLERIDWAQRTQMSAPSVPANSWPDCGDGTPQNEHAAGAVRPAGHRSGRSLRRLPRRIPLAADRRLAARVVALDQADDDVRTSDSSSPSAASTCAATPSPLADQPEAGCARCRCSCGRAAAPRAATARAPPSPAA